jgi:hypothetical protein
MDEEQSGNRNSAGLDPAAERTPLNQRGKTHRILEDKGIFLHQIKKGS